jgi:hypothetical protein
MKTSFLTLIAFLSLTSSFASPNIKATVNNGSWTSNATWNLNRNPSNTDTVTIPAGITVQINSNINTPGNGLYIIVYGTLKFVGGGSKLDISSLSWVVVEAGGLITSTGSPSQTLTIGSNTDYSGNGAPIVGPQYANSTTGNGFLPFIITLPVKFNSFSVSHKGNNNFIQWSTSEEINAKDFTIEKSIDGISWNTIGVIKATGNTNYTSDYSFSDNNINSAVNYYRIKETDLTGELTYTSIKSIKSDLQSQLNISISSMGNSKILLQFSSEVKGVLAINYISLSGQILAKQEINNPAAQQILSNTSLHGNYFISVTTEQGQHLTKQVIL